MTVVADEPILLGILALAGVQGSLLSFLDAGAHQEHDQKCSAKLILFYIIYR